MDRLKPVIRIAALAAPAVVALAFVVVQVRHLADRIEIVNFDYFPLVDRAMSLNISSWDGWVNKVHPVGFSWLVRLGIELGFDAARFGQALSVLGGVLGLVGVFLIAWAVSRSMMFALVCQLFTACIGYFLYYSGFEGNDMLPAGLQMLSVGALAFGLANPPDGYAVRVRWVVFAAVTVGLAYLMRYTGMIVAGVSLLVLIGVAVYHRSRALWKATGVYLVVVVLVTTLQWIPSLIVTGSPFSNDQGQNVWFHVYRKADFLAEWTQAPSDITVAQVFAMNPGKFVRHWWGNFESFWLSPEAAPLGSPLSIFAQAGFIYLLVRGKTVRPAIRFLLGLFVVALSAALSLMRLDPRFLIAVLPIEVVGALYFFYRVIPTHWRFRGIRLPLLPVIAVIGFLFAIQSLLDYVSDVPAPPPALIEANEILRAGGMRQAQEVISTDLSLQDLSSRSRTRFPQAYWVAPTSGTLDALIETAHTNSFRFLIYDKLTGPAVYPNLTGLLSPESRPAGLTPIYLEPQREFAIYRIDDVLKEPTTTVAMLEQDITLQQAQVYTSRAVFDQAAREVGLYLYWRAGHKLQSSFKVFVHILDESGQPVAQDDGVPVLWTYPTSMWKVDETVVDFHRVRVAAIDPHKSYTLVVGMYNETTGDRLDQVDASGNIIDDKIVLEKSFLTTESLASQ